MTMRINTTIICDKKPEVSVGSNIIQGKTGRIVSVHPHNPDLFLVEFNIPDNELPCQFRKQWVNREWLSAHS